MAIRGWFTSFATLFALTCFPPGSRADPFHLITLGDSLTDTYTGKPYAGPNLGWTDQLVAQRSGDITLHNFALAGSTSTTLLSQGQHTSAVNLIQAGTAKYVTLAIGANDIGAFLAQVNPAMPATLDPSAHAATLIGNVATTVAALQAAGGKVILANVPNIADTPSIQILTGGSPVIAALIGSLTDAVNTQLAALAQAKGIPLVDLRGLNALSSGPVLVGGTDVGGMLYSIDGFHPSSIGAGLLANVELEALRLGYGIDVPRFSDAELLQRVGLIPIDTTASFDAARFVTASAPEPSSLLLFGMGSVGGYLARRRRAG
jgi:lysophospholipase L1-like esterase